MKSVPSKEPKSAKCTCEVLVEESVVAAGEVKVKTT